MSTAGAVAFKSFQLPGLAQGIGKLTPLAGPRPWVAPTATAGNWEEYGSPLSGRSSELPGSCAQPARGTWEVGLCGHSSWSAKREKRS